jgi:hypothetical protein
MTPLERLKRRICEAGDINKPETARPLVSLEEFFEGNDDYGSIGYNFYPDQPSPSEFYELFKQIRSRPEVANVLVEVCQHEMSDEWPSTDTVWIITSASIDTLVTWLGERFRADEIFDGWTDHVRREAYQIEPGMKAIGIWWD